MLYIVCSLGFPQQPPDSVAMEMQQARGSTREMPYNQHILARWQPNYTLNDVVNEALSELQQMSI